LSTDGARFVFGRNQYFGRPLKWAAAIDDARDDDPRADLLPSSMRLRRAKQRIGIVGEVAHVVISGGQV